jgi:toxin secretion/phage lysis holin
MEKYFNGVSLVFGIIGGTVAGWLGGYDVLLNTLLVLVVADYVTGVIKGIVNKELSSKTGFNGLIKKILIFTVIAVSVALEQLLTDSIPLREIVIMFYISNEGISFLENISAFIDFPQQLKDVFIQIRDKEDK